MKHILLGTTALVAAGLMAAPASAQEGVKLGLGGYYFGAMGGNVSEDNEGVGNDFDDIDFKQDVEVHFKGETTLDNGITVGARIELEGQQQSDQVDEVWAYFSGGFGELRFGDDDDAYAQTCYLVPTASGAFGADSPFLNFSNGGTNATCPGLSSDSTKLIYFTPSFGGFQFVGSYSPDDNENTGGNYTGTGNDDDGGLENIFSAAVTYTTEIDAFSVAVGGGGSWAEAEDLGGVGVEPDDTAHYNAYLQVGFAGFTVGGVYHLRENTSGFTLEEDSDSQVFGAGVTYGFEAWTVGLGWTHGDYEFNGGDDETDLDIYQLTAAYALGPGVTLDAMVGYNDGLAVNSGFNATDEDYEAWEVGVGFGLAF